MKIMLLTYYQSSMRFSIISHGQQQTCVDPFTISVFRSTLFRKTNNPHLYFSIWKFSEAALQNSYKLKKKKKAHVT